MGLSGSPNEFWESFYPIVLEPEVKKEASSHHRHFQVQHGKVNLSRLRNGVEHP